MKNLVFPDIHGRTYWKDVLKCVNLDDFDKIIFLGDYLDPYRFEMIEDVDALENFKEILKFKKKNYDKVVLLIGNHDFYYYIEERGPSRWSYRCHEKLEKLFKKNRDCFQFAFDGDGVLYTHAGCTQGWKDCVEKYFDIVLEWNADSINNIENHPNFTEIMGMVSSYRGGFYGNGSCIWSDLSEHSLDRQDNIPVKQVFGHTLQLDTSKYSETRDFEDIKDGDEKISIEDGFAMLDCRHAFIVDEDKFEFTKL